jgi:tetratricopeptide (TPR) repeat protein
VIPVQQSVSPTPANSSIIPGLLAVAALVFLYYKVGVKNKKLALAGLFIFFILLVIPVWYGVLSPLGEQYEHRIYTSLAGLFVFISQLNFNSKTKIFNYVMVALLLAFSVKTLLRLNVYKNDTTYLEEGIADSPENYMFYATKANLMYERHNIGPALAAFTNAIRLQPGRAHLYNNRGNAYYELGQRKEALEDYTTALRLSNNDPAILLTRCMTYTRYEDYENAMTDLKALKKCCADKVPPALENNIVAKWTELQFIRINTQIAKEPGNAELYITRAQLFFEAKLPAETLRDLKKACDLEPENKEYKKYYEQLSSSFPR